MLRSLPLTPPGELFTEENPDPEELVWFHYQDFHVEILNNSVTGSACTE